MAPKTSLLLFNRHIDFASKALESVVTRLEAIDLTLPTAAADANTLRSQLTAEYQDVQPRLEVYLNMDTLPEGLTEEILQAGCFKLKELVTKGELAYNKISTSNPIACSTMREIGATRPFLNPTVLNQSFLNQSELPRMQLPKFSGLPNTWTEFYNKFLTVVHDNASLTPKQKLLQLINHLQGSAYDKISQLPLNDDSYETALKILTDRYQNKRLAVKTHCQKLLQLPNANIKSASSIRDLIDVYTVNFSSLKALNVPDPYHSIYSIYLLGQLDAPLRERFESTQGDRSRIPKVEDIINFLTNLAEQKEVAEFDSPFQKEVNFTINKNNTKVKKRSNYKSGEKNFSSNFNSATTLTVQATLQCGVCGGAHLLGNCPGFLRLSPRERFKEAKFHNICIVCLRSGHRGSCATRRRCSKCQSPRHHSLLHFPHESVAPQTPSSSSSPSSTINRPTSGQSEVVQQATADHTALSACVSADTVPPKSILLATCLVKLQVSSSNYIIVRAILDSASQVSFISETCAELLKVKRFGNNISISGIGLSSTPSRGVCNLSVNSLSGDMVSKSHNFLILPKITRSTPCCEISDVVYKAAKNLVLADPTFGKPSPVDALLGADLVASAVTGAGIPLGSGLPLAVPTVFGFVLMGSAPLANNCNPVSVAMPSSVVCELPQYIPYSNFEVPELHSNMPISLVSAAADSELSSAIKCFWELEEPPSVPAPISVEDERCEAFFADTTQRLSTGRYQVRLPFKEEGPSLLGDSFNEAFSRFRSLERKFSKNPEFKELYEEFINDYITQDHMVLIHDPSIPKYYIPHHGIFKTHGDTQKIRVVFDASAKTSSGYSLNDVLLTGPKLQTLISDILTLFRRYKYVFTSDIKQMFRQIAVHEADCVYQCILWRSNPSEPIKIYSLRTVTYGLSCSPYLALRSLRQLAYDEISNYPLASRAVLSNFFVDDLAAGADTLQETKSLQSEIITLLSKGCFILSKWASNNPQLLPTSVSNPSSGSQDDCSSVLGLRWTSSADCLQYPIEEMFIKRVSPVSKRLVLAQTAKLYDPCGWIAPIIFRAKCFLQTLWRKPLDWDSVLPADMAAEWHQFVTLLSGLGDILIPRPLNLNSVVVQLHGFADASQLGYGAVLYITSQHMSTCNCTLLACKTKVAPLKVVTIPRLELLGAHLLSKLVNHYFQLLNSHLQIEQVYMWTDSTIVLEWIKTPPCTLKTFIANRVAQIADLVPGSTWLHVPSSDNPADMASRGCSPLELKTSQLWWSGPWWLSQDMSSWPSQPVLLSHDPSVLELRSLEPCSLLVNRSDPDLFSHISSWSRCIHVIKIIIRWLPRYKSLSGLELYKVAHNTLLRFIQTQTLHDDVEAVRQNKLTRVAVQRLVPFIDEFGLLRARGRLAHAQDYLGRHPVILPKRHPLVSLLIQYTHIKLGHAGPSQVQYHLSLNYWILTARQIVRYVIHRCVDCFRVNPRASPPLMADLPAERVNPSPVFYYTGMDYCGPFQVKASSLRKAPLLRVYLCIFVCMSVKAVHLEVALDLSTNAFIDALKRFVSRRGCPRRLYSDCGTNFKGAERSLQREVNSLLQDPQNSQIVQRYAEDNNIEFSFLPASAPSMGGLWERAVRSTKFHLKRIIGANTLTLSQFTSLCIQVEGILNSRPLVALSSDPDDCQILSPGHFLIGRPIAAPPEADWSLIKDGSLRHYELIQALTRRFWKQWHLEYLSTIQARTKWYKSTPNLQVGDIVVLEEPNVAPRHWPLGKIVKVFPASDGVVRRAEVRTAAGIYLRPANKLYRLPMDN